MDEKLKPAFKKVTPAERVAYQFVEMVEQNGLPEEQMKAAKLKEAMLTSDNVLQDAFTGKNGQRSFQIGENETITLEDPTHSANQTLENTKPNLPIVSDAPTKVTEYQFPTIADTPMPPARIHQPTPLNYAKYAAAPEWKEEDIAQEFSDYYSLRTFQENFYILQAFPYCYTLLRGNNIQRMIVQFCREHLQQAFYPAFIDKVVKILLYDDRLAVKEKYRLPLFIWAFADGLVDIRNRQKIPDAGRLFFTRCFQCNFIPEMECPQFDQLVTSISGGNERITELLWQVIGYILSNDTKAKVFFTFAGPKDTGKSLIANVITDILQEDTVASCGIGDFGGRFVAGSFVGKRLITCMDATDAPLGAKAVGTIKSITGGDNISAERKFKDAETVRLDCVFLFGTNHSIRAETSDAAFTEREILIPFLFPVPKEKQDKFLLEKLKREQSGIVNKAIAAYLRLVAANYVFCPVGNMLPENVTIDPAKVIRDFTENYCDFSDANAKISTSELFRSYESFCKDQGLPTVDKWEFSGIFNKQNPTAIKKKINPAQQGYVGVRLLSKKI